MHDLVLLLTLGTMPLLNSIHELETLMAMILCNNFVVGDGYIDL